MLATTLAALVAALPLRPADYSPLEEAEAILMADVAVEGTIVEITEPSPPDHRSGTSRATLTLQVHEVLFGTLPDGRQVADTLTVGAFEDWTCAARHAPYAKGQRAVFLLQFERSETGAVKREVPPSVMGPANEGECPLVGDTVYHQAFGVQIRSEESDERFRGWKHEVAGKTYYGIATPRDEFLRAVRGLRRCFHLEREPDSPWLVGPEHVERTCSVAELRKYAASSRLAASFVVDSKILFLARQ